MIVLASVTGTVIWLVLAVVVGLIKHFSESASGGKEPPRTGTLRPKGDSGAGGRQQGTSEEERTRKFLEALGLPADAMSAPPARRAAEVLRPVTERARRGATERPVPPILAPTVLRPAVRRAPAQTSGWAEPTRVPALPVPAPEQTVAARVRLPELETPSVPEFHTRSSEVTAIPFELARSVVGELYTAPDSAISLELRRLVSTPTALRSAILLREILGPPRCLQSLDPDDNVTSH